MIIETVTDPALTFFCELEANDLEALFADPNVTLQLQKMGAGVSMGLLDLSDQRAAVVRHLNELGIPVTAWLLLPKEQGYWFNLDNFSEAVSFYGRFREWVGRCQIHFSTIGLDIEPDIRDMNAVLHRNGSAIRNLVKRTLNRRRLQMAQMAYTHLVMMIKADGYRVESYQFPIIADERKTGSTLIQRSMGVIDIPVDREVLMLYSSFLGGAGMLWSYAPDAQGIGVGSTGGGVELEGIGTAPVMNWHELRRDLLLAYQYTSAIYIYSLEGCVQQGILDQVADLNWEQPVAVPIQASRRVDGIRLLGQSFLWLAARPLIVLAAILGISWLFHDTGGNSSCTKHGCSCR
jgi:hypothetical protein